LLDSSNTHSEWPISY